MAKGQVKKVPVKVQAKTKAEVQADNMVFALDIGTRSIIGMVGVVEEDKVKIIAIEKEEHSERAMIDGQIENIDKVSTLAKKVKRRLENKVHVKLKRVSVAAAGRALRTSRVDYEMELPGTQLINDEVINRLEAGAIGKAEQLFDAENEAQEDTRRFYLVGYTVCEYYLDQYLISSLKDHRGKHIKVDLIATFLPSEVVESLYTTMNKIGLEVASITLEPIAAINAAIPENLRLLNLVIVDIGAGTSDIAACTGGSVTGYTMATIAGDEITEAIMKEFLVDFMTAENMKAQIDQEGEIAFTDILGFERKASRDDVFMCIQGVTGCLCKEIAGKILEVNGAAPSALFLAGGGSKLSGLKEGLTAALEMDPNRVAVAGNNFRANAFSDEYDLNSPDYTTPLGIAISSGLNLINDSFRVILNGKSAKLFRSGSFTIMNLLMMNGYGYQDMLGRSGLSVSVRVNGKRKVFYGMAAQPASLFINRREGKLSDIVHAGDNIEFVPAVNGISAKPCVKDIEGAAECLELTLNGQPADLETPLKNGDIIMMMLSDEQLAARKREAEQKAAEEAAARKADQGQDAPESEKDVPEQEKESEEEEPEEPIPEPENEPEAEGQEAPEPENAQEAEEPEEPDIPGLKQESEAGASEKPYVAELKQEPETGAPEKPYVAGLKQEPETGEPEKPYVAEPKQGSEAGAPEKPYVVEPKQEPEAGAPEKSYVPGLKQGSETGAPEKSYVAEPKQGPETGAPEKPYVPEPKQGSEAEESEKQAAGIKKAEDEIAEEIVPESRTQNISQKSTGESARKEKQLQETEPVSREEKEMLKAEPEIEVKKTPETKPEIEVKKMPETKPEIKEQKIPETKPEIKEQKIPETKPEIEVKKTPETKPEIKEQKMPETIQNIETELEESEAEPFEENDAGHKPQQPETSSKERKAGHTAGKWYSIDSDSAVQGTLALEVETRGTSAFDAAPAKKAPAAQPGTILFYLNDAPLRLPLKKDGDSYYLMDMIEHSGIDLKQPKGRVTLSVNGEPGIFMQKLSEGDIIRIVEEG